MTNTELADLFEEVACRLRQSPGTPISREPRSKKMLFTEREMAEQLSISLRHIISLRDKRIIPHVKLGRSIRYNPEKVEKAIGKLTVPEV